MKAKRNNSHRIPIVGIGASAGGLEALELFLGNTPDTCGIAFVIIQHLDPTTDNSMVSLLQRSTKMQVLLAKDNLKIKPDCVYVIPPNKNMSVSHGTLHLFEPTERRGLRLPIDFFFNSLADDLEDKSVGIILSGMGSDGTSGAKAIRNRSGFVMVQTPSTAKFDSMPRSIVNEGLADAIAQADELPKILLDHFKNIPLIKTESAVDRNDHSALEKIMILLRSHTGHDFTMYKKSTIYRRIERRMDIHKIDKIASYVRFLQENTKEQDILFKELLIGVTNFFRDPPIWEILKNKIIPSMIESQTSGHIFRAWAPGCSTGEEAYSLAIIFKEALEMIKPTHGLSLQIFATDIDNDAIDKARRGVYPLSVNTDIQPERLKRFFVKEEKSYRVSPEIREMVVFAPQNVLMHPPFTKLDIITCRNLLIYLDAQPQKKLLTLFHYSLRPEGILMLGNSETIGNLTDLFTNIYDKSRIYKRTDSTLQIEPINFPSFVQATPSIKEPKHMKSTENIQSYADQILLQQFSPAGVLINDKGDILYVNGRTGKYLEPAAGKANWNIYAMSREGFRNELSAGIRQAVRQKTTVLLHHVKVEVNESQVFDVTILPIEKPAPLNGMLMILFKDLPTPEEEKLSGKKRKKNPVNERINELELELQQAREEKQTAFEEMQTSQEELKSSNEELQSTNEELQSTNEELTTSKEEMQSINEELQTVNAELQSKVEELSRTNDDMNNLLNSTDLATLFLDGNLHVRRFTTQAIKIFKLIPGDVGRPITDLSTELIYTELTEDSKEVLRTLIFSEKSITNQAGSWFNVRIMPYRTIEDKIDGLVITFTDITTSKKLEKQLKETALMLRAFINNAPSVIIGLSSDGKIIEFNAEAEKLFGHKRVDVLSSNYVKLFIPSLLQKQVEDDMKRLFADTSPSKFENHVKTAGGEILLIEWSATKLIDDAGKLVTIIAIGQNISKP